MATIVGGGVLSLPLAFAKCGIPVATVLMIMAAVVTERTLNMLCMTARRTGATSYGEIGGKAFGEWMEWFISFLLFVFLLFIIVAYMILIQDIWTPLILLVFGKAFPVHKDTVLIIFLLLLSPVFVRRSLHALRWNCYVGFAAVSVLCGALAYHALQSILHSSSLPKEESRHNAGSSLNDVFFALPIIMLSFICHFNVLSIQGALHFPSRQRMEFVISTALVACFILQYLVGLCGFLYAGSAIQGNILLNVSDDWIFLVGRIGCGTTILVAAPIMLLPCRASMLELVEVACIRIRKGSHPQHSLVSLGPGIMDEETPLLKNETIPSDSCFSNPFIHYGGTAFIVILCYMGAVKVDGVATVWSLCGSSMAFIIGFVLPAACFLKIHRETTPNRPPVNSWYIGFAWVLLILSLFATVGCTYNTIVTTSKHRNS